MSESETESTRTPADPMAEIDAMKKIAEALEDLDAGSIQRVLRWAGEHYSVQSHSVQKPEHRDRAVTSSISMDQHTDLPDFYTACNPGTDAEKALVLGYWLQYKLDVPDFDTQSVNTELKHLGYPVGNITRAFDNLEASQPRLVIQVRKLGTTKQARKRMKLTVEGKKAVEQMVSVGRT